jgi:hypothetical protein
LSKLIWPANKAASANIVTGSQVMGCQGGQSVSPFFFFFLLFFGANLFWPAKLKLRLSFTSETFESQFTEPYWKKMGRTSSRITKALHLHWKVDTFNFTSCILCREILIPATSHFFIPATRLWEQRVRYRLLISDTSRSLAIRAYTMT